MATTVTVTVTITVTVTVLDEPDSFIDGYGGDVSTYIDTVLNGASSGGKLLNLGVHPNYEISNTQNMIVRFDLSSLTGKTCTSAKLYLYKSYPQGEGGGTITANVYMMASANEDWIEGVQSLDTAAEDEPCWNAKAADGAGGIKTAWAGGANGCGVSGTDHDATALGSLEWTPIDDAIGTEYEIDLDAEEIEGKFGGYINLVIKNSTAGGDHVGLSDNSTAAYRPKLVVEYV